MQYISTRGATDARSFSEVLLMGLAPDGGLMMPKTYPQVDADLLAKWRTLSYAELAFEIMSLFVDDIDSADLRAMLARTYTEEVCTTVCWCKNCPMAQPWPSKTWQCSFWVRCLSMCWRVKTKS